MSTIIKSPSAAAAATQTVSNTFFYSGISFPPKRSASQGFWATTTDQNLISQSLYVLLNTRKGEMPMSPNFGTSMDDNLFDAVDSATQGILCQQIQNDIQTWEPRVIVNAVSAYSYENVRMFNIDMTVVLTGQQFSTQIPINQWS